MRPAGGVEQDPLRAGVEVGPRSLDDRGRRVAPGGDAERLPDRPTGGDDLLDGLVAGELDRIGVDRGDDLGDPPPAGVGGDRDDPRRRRREGPGDAGEGDGLAQLQGPWRAGDEIEADRVGARPDRGQNALRVGDPADLRERGGRAVGGVRWRLAGRDEGPRGCGGFVGSGEGLADERGVEADGPPRGNPRGIANAGFGHDETIVGNERAQPNRPIGVHRKGPEVAVVDPDQAGPGRERPLELALIVRLHEWLQPDLQGALDKPREPLRRVEHGQEQHGIGAGRPEMGELDVLDDELLRQDRDGNGRPDRSEVVDRAAEPVRLAQDRDRGRAAGFVSSGSGDDVLARR